MNASELPFKREKGVIGLTCDKARGRVEENGG
jgi:hypothetical protein